MEPCGPQERPPLDGPRDRPHEQWLFASEGLALGHFHCPPDARAWRATNRTGPWPLVAFPGTPVWIEHEEGRPFVADRTRAVFYRSWQEYGRRLLDPRGDHCLYVTAAPAVYRDAVLQANPTAADGGGLGRSSGPLDRSTFALLRAVRRSIDGRPDPLRTTEALLRVLSETVHSALSPSPSASRRRPATNAAHSEIVRGALAVLAGRFHERLGLEDLAREVHVSPYHLARLFREVTGTTVHRHLTDLRVRAALDHLVPGSDLAGLAADLGFSHHSHLTNSFRRAFGMSPAEFRAHASRSDRAEVRTIVQAASRPAS
jgi:AraC family transcriptional regulator